MVDLNLILMISSHSLKKIDIAWCAPDTENLTCELVLLSSISFKCFSLASAENLFSTAALNSSLNILGRVDVISFFN